MKQKEKEKLFFRNKSVKRLVLMLAFFVFSLFIFFEKVDAADLPCCTTEQLSKCEGVYPETSKTTCYLNQGCDGNITGKCREVTGQPIVTKYTEQQIRDANTYTSSKGNFFSRSLLWVFNVLLYTVFQIMGALLIIAGNLFDWGVDAEMFRNIMNLTAVETGWKMVRDFLNLFFILILLFSAFCTIFQVEKYHIKKILLNLVIMALLVNFSFPISRVIIDAGNIPMYYFFQNIAGSGNSISKNVFNTTNSENGNATGIMNLVLPDYKTMSISGEGTQTMKLIAAIIFLFTFALTLLVMAVLLIIRILVLVILVIFSPVGFVAAIFPGFSKYSSSWWEQLFKQSFFGAVMAFMLYVSLSLMGQFQNSFANKMAEKAAVGSVSSVTSIIQGGVTLAVPIVLLWIGIFSAKNMGAMGAGAVVGRAAKVAKWAGKKFSGYSAAKRQYDAFAAQRKKREDEKAKNRWGGKLGKLANKTQDTVVGKIPIIGGSAKKRVDKMRTDERRKDVDDKAKSLEDSGVTISAMNVQVNNSFDATTGAINANTTEDQAAHAKAYTRKSADRQKLDLQRELSARNITDPTSELKNILHPTTTPPGVIAAVGRIRAALTATPPTTPNENDLRTVTAYMNDRAEDVMRNYIK